MPNSYSFFKTEIRDWFINNIPTTKRILDVGPGQGTYSDLIRMMGYKMDAVEIWAPYIQEFGLRNKYDNVFVEDIRNFNITNYDFIILGDVLEHLSKEDAQSLIAKMDDYGIDYLIAIPYMMEQDGEEYGNEYETHLQPDLTPEVMSERYPGLIKLFDNQWYGYYVNRTDVCTKAYVLYATESYKDTVQGCVDSIRAFSSLPIYVYMLNSDVKIDKAYTIKWMCDVANPPQNNYIDRTKDEIYQILIQRPAIIKHALKWVDVVAYIDSDTVATKHINKIFDFFPKNNHYPYFVEGIYDWLHVGERGGADSREDLSTTLEHPACELFGVDQYVRERYRQTGYFVAGKNCIEFLNEWWTMCNSLTVMSNPTWYAPYHEETLANVLLWKWKAMNGLPYIYTNASLEKLPEVYERGRWGEHIESWFRLPDREEYLLFLHGEKNISKMHKMIEYLQKERLNILFLAPHLSTGGMPAFLLKRIECLQSFEDVNIIVVEYANYSDEYVVQKNQIRGIVKNFYTLGENKLELIDIMKRHSVDVIHIEEMIEDAYNNWSEELREAIYNENRTWRVVETCHNIVFKPDIEKRFHPDAYAFCTPYHFLTFEKMPSRKYVLEYPIEKQDATAFNFGEGKHVLNVGLWTPGKNQGEAVELARQMPDVQFHFVGNQAGNFRNYWEPIMKNIPPNVHVWGERHDVGSFMKGCDVFLFNSTFECNPLVIREAIGYGKPIIARNLPQYGNMFTEYITDLNPQNLKEQVYEQLKNPKQYQVPENQAVEFGTRHINMYKEVVSNPIQPAVENITIIHHFVKQPFLEIRGSSKSKFKVKYYDEQGICHYENTINVQNWIKLNRSWYTKWTIKIWKDDVPYYEYTLNYTGKRVYIAFDSKSLGDTVAWIPYALEFKKKHNCHLIVSTFRNELFKDVYPELEFVEPGEKVNNLAGMYNIGWFYDQSQEPVLPNTIPLQQTATNILGLDYQEIRPRIAYTPCNKFDNKFVTIATNSTAGCKFWTKEAWQEVIDFLCEKGYEVINVSVERNVFKNCTQIEDTSIENTMNLIYNSKFFIGLSSGLSWLAWALGKDVVMISNFTTYDHEFRSNCIRITNEKICHGCWNNAKFKFDKGDWNWCPLHKGTDRQFECHKLITAKDVISKIQHLC